MCDESFNGRAQRRNHGVVCFVSLAEASAWRCLTRGDDIASLVTLCFRIDSTFLDNAWTQIRCTGLGGTGLVQLVRVIANKIKQVVTSPLNLRYNA